MPGPENLNVQSKETGPKRLNKERSKQSLLYPSFVGSSIALIGTMRNDGKKGLNRETMSKKVNADV